MTDRIKNWNFDRRKSVSLDLLEIAEEISTQVERARDLIRQEWPEEYSHADAYVFANLDEHCENANPYNTSLNSMAAELLNDDKAEPIQNFGESWADDDTEAAA